MNPALRLTPNNSPFFRSPTPRSPTKTKAFEEQGLRLKRVIGSTTTSINAFDSIAAERCFAYTAGATAVLARVDEDLNIVQRFYRTKTSGITSSLQDSSTPWPATPTPNEARQRALGNVGKQPLPASPLATSTREWSDSPTGKTSTAKDRVKAATSVSLSPNGRWLAVGQTGYKPSIHIFSLAGGSSDVPVASICEHSFGVHALSWSPDSKQLASLGTINDGFLFVWNIDERTGSATLHSSNKVTNVVNDMVWMGRSIVTVGLRFLKVWRPGEDVSDDISGLSRANILSPRTRQEARLSDFGNSIISPRNKPLLGKNSLLNDLLEVNFIRVIPLSSTRAIVCAESGDICTLDDEGKAQNLTSVATAGFTLSTAALDQQGCLHIVGTGGERKRFEIENLLEHPKSIDRNNRRRSVAPFRPHVSTGVSIVASAHFGKTLVEISAQGKLTVRSSCDNTANDNSVTPYCSGHSDAIYGVHSINSTALPSASFFTFDASGQVCFWTSDGRLVNQLQILLDRTPGYFGCENELRVLIPYNEGSLLIAGDRIGTLSVTDIESRSRLAQARAHSAEITDVVSCERSGVSLLATVGRDRMVQLFSWQQGSLDLLQTMDDHAGSISCVLFSIDGNTLISCSADRSVVVRDACLRDASDATTIAFLTSRTLALKASPTSICFGNHPDCLLVAAMDKSVSSINYRTGQTGMSFKCSDQDGGEAAIMSQILFAPAWNGNPLIAGICSSDKSVRLYTEQGLLVARDYGHTEGVTSAALADSNPHQETSSQLLVTVAADSTIYLWDDTPNFDGSESSLDTANVEYNAPIRKVLPIAELSRLKRDKDEKESQAACTPSAPSSPQRLKKKSSRTTLAQPPKLEPAFRSTPYGSRRTSIRQRSPSPSSSPHSSTKPSVISRRLSLNHALRSKSSEDVLAKVSAPSPSARPPSDIASASDFAVSADAVCRGLRSLRKQLTAVSMDSTVTRNATEKLEAEIKLTVLALAESMQSNMLEETLTESVLDRVGKKMIDLLDERIRDRVQSEVREITTGPPVRLVEATNEDENASSDIDAIAGALAKTEIRS